MDRLYSVGKRFIKRLIKDDITIIQVGSYKGLMQLVKDRLSSRFSPRCLWATDLWIGWSLKEKLWWKTFLSFLENMTSWACLFLSGLKYIFQLQAHSWILTRSLFNVADEASTSWVTENNKCHWQIIWHQNVDLVEGHWYEAWLVDFKETVLI